MFSFIEPFFYNWLILGAVLMIIEVASFTLLFFWLAIAAFIMAGISYLLPDLSINAHLLTFSVIAVVCVVAWHRIFKHRQAQMGDSRMNNRAERYIGKTATLLEDTDNGRSKIRIEDSLWRVECDKELSAGTVVEIIAADGVTLHIKEK